MARASHILLHARITSAEWQPFLVAVRTIDQISPPFVNVPNSSFVHCGSILKQKDEQTAIQETVEEVQSLIDRGV